MLARAREQYDMCGVIMTLLDTVLRDADGSRLQTVLGMGTEKSSTLQDQIRPIIAYPPEYEHNESGFCLVELP